MSVMTLPLNDEPTRCIRNMMLLDHAVRGFTAHFRFQFRAGQVTQAVT